MIHFLANLFIFLLICSTSFASFRFSLVSEPSTLDPSKVSTSQSNYFYSLIFSGLYKYDDEKGLIPLGAKSCKWKSAKELICQLDPNMKWSDGTEVVASQYLKSFRYIIDPKSYARKPELLFSLKNAKEIYQGKLAPDALGVSAPKKFELRFLFAEADGDFLYKLTSPVLIPFQEVPNIQNWKTLAYNGNYKIQDWKSGHKIHLVPNTMNPQMKSKQEVEIYFIEEDSTSLRMYNSGQLDMVRRVPSSEISFYKDLPDFIQLPVARFDYIGFGGHLEKNKALREAMLYSVDYQEFAKLFHSLGRPGCPGLPDNYFTQVPCYNFNLEKAKQLLSQVKPEDQKRVYKFYFSSAGGEDIKRGVEWFMHQWKKNLGLNIEAIPMEQKMYSSYLKKKDADIFRRGIPLDRPSCMAAVENFHSSNDDNFLGLQSKELDKKIQKLQQNIHSKQQSKLCTSAIQSLYQHHRYLPLGKIHYSMMVKPKFKHWRFNQLNQLDLSLLE